MDFLTETRKKYRCLCLSVVSTRTVPAGDLHSSLKDTSCSANVWEVPGSTVSYAKYICIIINNPNPSLCFSSLSTRYGGGVSFTVRGRRSFHDHSSNLTISIASQPLTLPIHPRHFIRPAQNFLEGLSVQSSSGICRVFLVSQT